MRITTHSPAHARAVDSHAEAPSTKASGGLSLHAIALGVAALLSPCFALATPLGLEHALRVASSEHPSVVARKNELRAATMKLDIAERQMYPGFVAQSGKDSAGNQVSTLRLEQPLWTGGRITGEIDNANAGIRQAESGVVQAQQDIMLKVIASFTELGRVQARQLAAKANVEEHIRLDSMIERRVASNVSPASDGTQASARLAQARAESNQLEALAVRARSALTQATGGPVTDIDMPKHRQLDDASLESLTRAALDFSPALRGLLAQSDSITAEMAIRSSSAMPQLKMRVDRTFGPTSKTNSYLTLDVQTGAGFSAIASVKEAEARRDAIQSQMEVVRRELVDAVSAEWADLTSYRLQVRDLRQQVENTTSVFDSFVRQYAVGRKGWNDVLNAQREVTQSRYLLADADWGMLRSALRLQLLTGFMTAENISAILNPDAAVLASKQQGSKRQDEPAAKASLPAAVADAPGAPVKVGEPISTASLKETPLAPVGDRPEVKTPSAAPDVSKVEPPAAEAPAEKSERTSATPMPEEVPAAAGASAAHPDEIPAAIGASSQEEIPAAEGVVGKAEIPAAVAMSASEALAEAAAADGAVTLMEREQPQTTPARAEQES